MKSEIVGVVFLALFLLTAASLILYHADATSFVGRAGNNISAILFVSIGYSAYLFPVLFLLTGLWFLLREGFSFRVSIPISFFCFVFSLAGIMAVLAGQESKTGGIIGGEIQNQLSPILGPVGAVIVLGAVLLISIRVGSGISLVRMAQLVGRVFGVAGGGAKKLGQRRKEKSEESNKNKITEKIKSKKPTIITREESKPKFKKQPEQVQEEFRFLTPKGAIRLPDLSFLDKLPEDRPGLDKETLITNSKILEKKLADFDVNGHVVEVRPGPIITTYEFEPAPGIKVSKIANLSDDLALAMRAETIRILAPVPGKAVVGVEIPNQVKESIWFREILECNEFKKTKGKLPIALGKDVSGLPFVADLTKMPHLLVAGSTGSGKSVSINAMILSILFRRTPQEVRFLLIDPKMLELSPYEGIPHLLTPVVTNPKQATVMLKGLVSEMEKRYKMMSELGVKSIDTYNEQFKPKAGTGKGGKAKQTTVEEGSTGGAGEERRHGPLPYIVVVIDELADLMMTSGREVEDSLVRLSQMARASGIHLILATQRPSVDVITGLIKSNFPSRISFKVPSKTDSRTILDASGGETLLGHGDMLFLPPGSSKLRRVHGAFVSESEVKKVTDFLKKQAKPVYEKPIIETKSIEDIEEEEDLGAEFMAKYREAVEMAMKLEMVSTSYIQRRFRIGYNTAARIIEKMEQEGIVGPSQGSRPREVLKRNIE